MRRGATDEAGGNSLRVLFTTLNGAGHFHPLVPLAHALRAAGHDVAFASLPPFRPTIERAGFPAFAAGFGDVAPEAGVIGAIRAAMPLLPEAARQQQQVAFAASPEAGVWWVIGNIFAGFLAERSVPDLLAIAAAWRPDIVIRESFEFGGYLAAEAVGVPHVTVQNSTFPPDDGRLDERRRALNERRSALGLPPDPAMRSLHRYL